MGATYTRQSSFSDGDTINSDLFNNEYDQLVTAFSSTLGHTHDGTTGEGGVITKIGPAQEIVVAGTTVLPKTNNTVDLGSSTYKFKDAYFAGNITADGSITYNGNVVLGSDSTDTLTINATIQGSSLIFEGATVDAFETTLAIPDASADITITLPNATDTLVGKATTDTLTNKTLTSPTINTPTITGNTTFSDGAYDFNIASHDGTNGLKLGGTLVTATATELNIIDGVTATTAELNIMDGVTATAAELNILDGVTATTSELNIMDGVTATTAELNILDGVTATATELNLIDGVTATTAEINYVDGVTSNIQTQMDTKAPLASPTLTGTPLSTTAVAGTNNTQIATTAFVTAAVTSEDTLAEMNDTTISAPADSDFLVYTGSAWVNETGATARTSLGVDAAGTINYTHPTSAGNKHIPTGGASGQFLKYDSSGTAVWAADNDTVYTLSTASASVLGGIKVGTNLSIASGVLSSTDTNTTYLGGTGITLTGTTFATDYGTTSGTAAEGNHTHSGYETEGTAVAMAIALG